jgi:hypothetical protein
MSLGCPHCRSIIPLQDVNVSADIALCRACGNTFRFSEIAPGRTTPEPDLNLPPKGTWFEQLPQGFRVGVSTRSWIALFLIPFTCVWGGGSLGGIYGSQIRKGHLELFNSLFGIPFLIGSCVLITMCAMTLAGKIEVTKIDERLTVFTGVGPLGWSRRFSWSDFSRVREESRMGGWNFKGQGQLIVLEGARRASFGAMLSDEKRYFIFSALQKMLRNQTTSSFRKP